MKATKTVLVICALGYATSTMIKKTIVDCFEEKGINNWAVEAIGLGMSNDFINDADIIVTSLSLDQSEYKVPVFNGVPLISGIGKDAVLDDILASIKTIDSLDH